MEAKRSFTSQEIHYLQLLSKQFPTVQAAGSEIVRLRTILNLPKGTEHFMSDIHGEYEAFLHILNSGSGETKEKLVELFEYDLSPREINDLATLIYYPSAKLALMSDAHDDLTEWYNRTIHQLILVCYHVSSKHTHKLLRSYMPEGYAPVIDELLYLLGNAGSRRAQYENIISTIIEIGEAGPLIEAICHVIKCLTVDHLHIVGDIFDRGPRADIVMDSLMNVTNVDIQWGNHDVLWMGAASGSRTLVATVLVNSIRYNNLDLLETGYGISLRPLSMFASEVYKHCDTSRCNVKLLGEQENRYTEKEKHLSSQMYKASLIILFKLEGQKILRRPEFGMEDRLLLHNIDYENKTVTINGEVFSLYDCDFPTVDPKDPYKLTEEELHVITQLTESFRHSEKLQKHIRFMYAKGGLYKVMNGNLLFHGCIPMTEDGEFLKFNIGGKIRSGREFLDYAEKTARKAYYDKRGTPERQFGLDFLWWLWCGRNSPIFGRDRMATFERHFVKEEPALAEPKNAYYRHYEDPAMCDKILKEFGLEGPHCHIVNGHVPVRVRKGESPVKGGGKLIVIDGGFSKAYQPTSGIAGYTLIFNSRHLRLMSHQPFAGKWNAIHNNADIDNEYDVFEKLSKRMLISETDEGRELQQRVDDLLMLLEAYRSGAVAEGHK